MQVYIIAPALNSSMCGLGVGLDGWFLLVQNGMILDLDLADDAVFLAKPLGYPETGSGDLCEAVKLLPTTSDLLTKIRTKCL